jgi:hypothetical protein
MLYILGSNTDDKGTQLEQLAQDMLNARGYRKLTLNAVGPGGAEYDVTGEREVAGTLGGAVFVLGECKAWQDPVAMDAWQKFLGKIYAEQLRRGKAVQGIFIALGGVNGNVYSSYDELSKCGLEVELIRNTELEEFLSQHYGVVDVKQTSRMLSNYTARKVTAIDLCYYERACYRLVRFSSDSYTLWDASGKALEDTELDKIRKLVDAAPAPGKYVDLLAEARAQQRSVLAQKYVLGWLMRDDGRTSVPALSVANPAEGADFTSDEIQSALSSLAARGWVEVEGDEARLKDVDTEGRWAHFIPMIRFWVPGRALGSSYLAGLRSAFYQRHIDEWLLDEISAVQANLSFPQGDRDALLWVFRLSPSALLNAVTRQQMITEGRECMRGEEIIDNTDRNLFYDMLCQLLAHDYDQLVLGPHFWERGVAEIELGRGTVLKSSQGVIASLESHVRYTKPPSNTNVGVLPLIVLNNAPQPWEET